MQDVPLKRLLLMAIRPNGGKKLQCNYRIIDLYSLQENSIFPFMWMIKIG